MRHLLSFNPQVSKKQTWQLATQMVIVNRNQLVEHRRVTEDDQLAQGERNHDESIADRILRIRVANLIAPEQEQAQRPPEQLNLNFRFPPHECRSRIILLRVH